jgi:hypothetical protein
MDQPENKLREFLQYLDNQLPGTARLYFSNNEREFIEAVDLVLEIAIRRLEENAASHNELKELVLSTMLSDLIRQAAIPCEKEVYRNGHVDVAIGHPRKPQFQYLGECKIYDGFRKHCRGCDQLLNRYLSGRDLRGFVLEFFDEPGMYSLLEVLKTQFDEDLPLEMKGSSTTHHIKGAFITLHRHFTKTEVEVLHLGCNLYVRGTQNQRRRTRRENLGAGR